MEIVIKIAQFLLSLSLLIIIHELGHFLFARLFGIRVEKFYLFFNPWFSLFRFRRGQTEYGVGWVPLGGYVKIAGMIDESMDTEQMARPQSDEFRSKPAWQRLLVMVGGVVMNVVLAVVIYCCVSYVWGDAYLPAEQARWGYVFNQGAKELGFRDGDRILSIDEQSVVDVDQIRGDLLIAKADKRVVVERDGERVQLTIPLEQIIALRRSGDYQTLLVPRVPFVVDSVGDPSAAAAGMLAGDRLVALNGTPARYFDEYRRLTPLHKGESVTLTVERDSAGRAVTREVELTLSPEGRMGLYVANPFSLRTRDYTLLQSIPAGIRRTGTVISDYWEQLKMIVSPKTRMYEELGGFLSIGSIFSPTWDWEAFWLKTAFLSIILAVMNILPIPALDGGHVLFLLWEVVTRRKPSDKFLERAQVMGLLLLLALLLYANGNDIYRFFIK